MAARGGIKQAAKPKFFWGTPQTLSYHPTKFQQFCSADHFLAKSSNSSGHPKHEISLLKTRSVCLVSIYYFNGSIQGDIIRYWIYLFSV